VSRCYLSWLVTARFAQPCTQLLLPRSRETSEPCAGSPSVYYARQGPTSWSDALLARSSAECDSPGDLQMRPRHTLLI
jgi:hypothetical protein